MRPLSAASSAAVWGETQEEWNRLNPVERRNAGEHSNAVPLRMRGGWYLFSAGIFCRRRRRR